MLGLRCPLRASETTNRPETDHNPTRDQAKPRDQEIPRIPRPPRPPRPPRITATPRNFTIPSFGSLFPRSRASEAYAKALESWLANHRPVRVLALRFAKRHDLRKAWESATHQQLPFCSSRLAAFLVAPSLLVCVALGVSGESGSKLARNALLRTLLSRAIGSLLFCRLRRLGERGDGGPHVNFDSDREGGDHMVFRLGCVLGYAKFNNNLKRPNDPRTASLPLLSPPPFA